MRGMLLGVYALTIFTSAALLFLVEPMFAKMVLPRLGGTPAVWTTCMVFFQAVLLAGYLYAHVATKWLRTRVHAVLHLAILGLAFVALPLAIPDAWVPRADANPIGSLLAILAVTVGLPFFAVSTSGPLLQAWFARTDHEAAKDPYFLYGASNLGSMIGLLGYPFALEPLTGVEGQSQLWTAGYALLVVLTGACGVLAARRERPPLAALSATTTTPIPLARKARWIALAAVPSSLMLGVTTHITTDVGAVPLLWVLPLALYIGSFVLVFARKPRVSQERLERLLPILVLALVAVRLVFRHTTWAELPLHLVSFFAFALVLHGALAKDRPPAEHLTTYYVLMSLGGVLGGIFNGIVAPLAFSTVLEYPLAIVAGCLLLPTLRPGRHALDLALPLALGLAVLGLRELVVRLDLSLVVGLILIILLPVFVCFTFAGRPVRFALGLVAIWLASPPQAGDVLHVERSFFSVHRVVRTIDRGRAFVDLFHGTTIHGRQRLDPSTLQPTAATEPLTYYMKGGPVADLVACVPSRLHVGVVGLGAGTIGAYAFPGQDLTYYEIDPVVARIAQDPHTFTYLSEARRRGAKVEVVLGDARLTIKNAPAGAFDLLFLDAFSSDSIPIHLLTREAFGLYQEKLAPGGMIALNISNRYFDLRPVIATMAADAHLVARYRRNSPTDEEVADGATGSLWLAIARRDEDLGTLPTNPLWPPVTGTVRLWTDAYSNIFAVLGGP